MRRLELALFLVLAGGYLCGWCERALTGGLGCVVVWYCLLRGIVFGNVIEIVAVVVGGGK
jgi:hypothetical protein